MPFWASIFLRGGQQDSPHLRQRRKSMLQPVFELAAASVHRTDAFCCSSPVISHGNIKRGSTSFLFLYLVRATGLATFAPEAQINVAASF